MSILTGPEIARQVGQGRILIEPYSRSQLNPASYDVRLGETIVEVMAEHSTHPIHQFETNAIDPKRPNRCRSVEHLSRLEGSYTLMPGRLYLGHTQERIRTDHYEPTIDGKSSIGRLGIFIHVTAGYGEPGFDGQYTLEIVVTLPTILYPGMLIGQVRFTTLEGEVQLYRGNYQGEHSRGPVASRAWRQFEVDPGVRREEDDVLADPFTGGSPIPLESLTPESRLALEAKAKERVVGHWKPRRERPPSTLVNGLLPGPKREGESWREWLQRGVDGGAFPSFVMEAFDKRLREVSPIDEPTPSEVQECAHDALRIVRFVKLEQKQRWRHPIKPVVMKHEEQSWDAWIERGVKVYGWPSEILARFRREPNKDSATSDELRAFIQSLINDYGWSAP